MDREATLVQYVTQLVADGTMSTCFEARVDGPAIAILRSSSAGGGGS